MVDHEIDFVVLWVDSNDPQWQTEKAKYLPKSTDDAQVIRYQDWENFKYWFRAVAKYAPWVRKIHLVTCGQVPQWLNTDHPKINMVNHGDYMPKNVLPTFNSNAIEVGIHRIVGLAEHFVLFNDDMFLTSPVNKEYFFRQGLPVDMPGFIAPPQKNVHSIFTTTLANNSHIIKKYFRKMPIVLKKFPHWFNFSYGKTFIRNVYFTCMPVFPGFVMPHLSVPYLKKDFEMVWKNEENALRATQSHRFRNGEDVTHFLIRNWRMCEGSFYPRKSKGFYFSIDGSNAAINAAEAIKRERYPEICINETCTGDEFSQVKKIINEAFADTHNTKCEFER